MVSKTEKLQIIFLLLMLLALVVLITGVLVIKNTSDNINTDYEDNFQIASSIVYSEINQNSTSSEIIESIKSNCELYTDYPSSCEESIKKVYREIMLDKLEQERINNKL